MFSGLKEKILSLRKEGKSYREIEKQLKCSKAVISYHSRKNGLITKLKNLDLDTIILIQEYYKTHTKLDTAKKYGISESTVTYHVNKKRVILTNLERKKNNYLSLKHQRDKSKVKAVEYKGGCCVNCGYKKSIWALEFHHIDKSKKDFSIGRFGYLAWDKIKCEIEKCILVCSNCHREIHELEFKEPDKYNNLMIKLSCSSAVRTPVL